MHLLSAHAIVSRRESHDAFHRRSLARGRPIVTETGTAAGDEPQVRVADNPDERRYEALLGDRLVGKAEYRLAGSRIIFFHTEVDDAVEGKGVGSRLARGALDDARSRGLRITPRCPFIAAYIRRHPEYADLVADPAARREG